MDYENELKEILKRQDYLLTQIRLLKETIAELKEYLVKLGV